jgi:hypothetical protein
MAKEKQEKAFDGFEIDAEFLAQLEKNEALDAQDGKDGLNVSFISLAKEKTKALDEDNKELYIEGLKLKDLFIQKTKRVLGKSIKVVPLAFFNLFAQYSDTSKNAKYLSTWTFEEGDKFPLVSGSYYDRLLPNGKGILKPITWVVVYLPDFPDIDKPVITFKSTGNKVAANWLKSIRNEHKLTTQCLFEVKAGKQTNADGDSWFEFEPKLIGLTFDKVADKVQANVPYVKELIELSNEYRSMYSQGTLIPSRINSVLPSDGNALSIEDQTDDVVF